jgi:hypothetical protein
LPSPGSSHELQPTMSSVLPPARLQPAWASCSAKWASISPTDRSVSTVDSEVQCPLPPPPCCPRSRTPAGALSGGMRSAPSGRMCGVCERCRAASQSNLRRTSVATPSRLTPRIDKTGPRPSRRNARPSHRSAETKPRCIGPVGSRTVHPVAASACWKGPTSSANEFGASMTASIRVGRPVRE